jgi:hypothetical protein
MQLCSGAGHCLQELVLIVSFERQVITPSRERQTKLGWHLHGHQLGLLLLQMHKLLWSHGHRGRSILPFLASSLPNHPRFQPSSHTLLGPACEPKKTKFSLPPQANVTSSLGHCGSLLPYGAGQAASRVYHSVWNDFT